jgi:HD-GYP domain-containing protein (c-di-GMP phosphodiesterase class II)
MASPFRALAPWNDVRAQLALLLHERLGRPAFLSDIDDLSARIDRLIADDPDGAIFAVMQFDQNDYGVNHSLQAAVICAEYGRISGWSEAERHSAIGAGLTMNVAMLDLQQEMYRQREAPSAAQRDAIRSHPQCGHDLLERLGLRDRLWLQIVIEHHESADGQGYPTGTGEPLTFAAALGLADRYSAKITRRLYRAALAPDAAIRELYQMNPGEARANIDRMVEAVGLWPPGTYVELANGETAVVATRGHGIEQQPLVYALLNAQLAEMTPTARDTSQPAFRIRGSAGPISMGATARLPRLVAAAAQA